MQASSRRLSQAAERGRRPLVSLTPLIDVVFILLIFFMLASSFADWRRIDLQPPLNARTGGGGLTGAMLVELAEDGRIRLSGEVIEADDLAPRVRDLLQRRPDQRFVVKTADAAPLQRLVSVLDSLSMAGAENIAFARQGG